MLKYATQPESQVFSVCGLNYYCSTDAITLISKDEVDGSTVSKNEANQVT